MAIPIDTDLYEKAKKIVYAQYKKPSAYRSGALVRKYKELGGRYIDTNTNNKNKTNIIDSRPLLRWFLEQWGDVYESQNKDSYPVYRPYKRITEKTPKTVFEIPKQRLLEQAKLKQIIKGKSNLPKF